MIKIKPMLAENGPPDIDSLNWSDYIAEWKYNGMRILGRKEAGVVSLQGRSGADYTYLFPELADLGEHILAVDAVVDGEVVCLGENGFPDFNKLQNRSGKTDPHLIRQQMAASPATFIIFDVLRVGNFDLTAGGNSQADLVRRKEVLAGLITPGGSIRLSPWIEAEGKALHARAVALGQEGVMAKTKSGLYVPGGRNRDWLKLKVPKFADYVICGYTKGTGWRADTFGAVVLGEPDGCGYKWVGCSGSGFTVQQVSDLCKEMQGIRTEESPLPGVKVPGLVSWVRPVITIKVKYFDISKNGQLIWPIFQEFRDTRTVVEKYFP